MLRKILFSLILVFSFLLIWINIALYTENFTQEETKNDIILQLNFLESELKENDAAKRMQEIFPEGYVFTNALYGLTWCELANSTVKSDSKLKQKAIKESLYAYQQLNTLEAVSTFDSDTSPLNGIFYVGWKNYLLSNIFKVDTAFSNYDVLKFEFESQCELIQNTLEQENIPYLESYPNQSWPADMFLAIASLRNHDAIYKPKYENDIKKWLEDIKSKLDPNTKLIPHKVKTRTGVCSEGARGSSIGLIIRTLAEIDPEFAKQQYDIYKKLYISKTIGLPSVSEYPKGINGPADIDSGPILFGVGFSGTIFSIGTLAKLGNLNESEMQYKTINAFGLSTIFENKKRYLFGQIPIADAFIAWGRATGLNSKPSSLKTSPTWRLQFHFFSILGSGVLCLLFFYRQIFSKLK